MVALLRIACFLLKEPTFLRPLTVREVVRRTVAHFLTMLRHLAPFPLQTSDGLDFGKDILTVDAVGHGYLRNTARQHREGERDAGSIEKGGFPQTAEADVAPLAEVELTSLVDVQHHALLHSDLLTAEELLDFGIINTPDNIQRKAGLGRVVLAGPLPDLDGIDKADILADRHRGDFGIVGFGVLSVKELIRIEHVSLQR